MTETATTTDELHLPHLLALIGGGLCVGLGIVNLYFSYGATDGSPERVPINSDFSLVGFSALNDIHFLSAADYAIPLIVIGVIAMVWANATAWKKTDGGW